VSNRHLVTRSHTPVLAPVARWHRSGSSEYMRSRVVDRRNADVTRTIMWSSIVNSRKAVLDLSSVAGRFEDPFFEPTKVQTTASKDYLASQSCSSVRPSYVPSLYIFSTSSAVRLAFRAFSYSVPPSEVPNCVHHLHGMSCAPEWHARSESLFIMILELWLSVTPHTYQARYLFLLFCNHVIYKLFSL
jgi:hypothetical protein